MSLGSLFTIIEKLGIAESNVSLIKTEIDWNMDPKMIAYKKDMEIMDLQMNDNDLIILKGI